MDLREKLRLVEQWVERKAAAPPPRREVKETVTSRRHVFPPDHTYGSISLHDLLSIDPSLLGLLARPPRREPVHLESTVFLDVETTSLGTGPQCRVFLVGIGRTEGEAFVVEQHLLEDPEGEAEMLDRVRPLLQDIKAIASFNGRLFDWPLLRARFLRLGLWEAPPDPVHLDLLYPARRVWRARVGSASLAALEAHVLGAHRRTDVPGWLVPALYDEYLERGDPGVIEPVLAHNLQDVLALPSLLTLLSRAVGDPAALEEAGDMLGVARIMEEADDLEGAQAAYAGALRGRLSQEPRVKAVLHLAELYRRTGKFQECARLLEEEAAGPLRGCAAVHLELSRLYERHLRDPAAAHAAAMRALDLLASDPTSPHRARARMVEDLVRRLDRLERRLAGASAAQD